MTTYLVSIAVELRDVGSGDRDPFGVAGRTSWLDIYLTNAWPRPAV